MPIPPQTPASNHSPDDTTGGAGDQVDRAMRAALARHAPVFVVVDALGNIMRYPGGDVAR